MTVLNLFVSANRAIMAVDTLRVEWLGDGKYGSPLGHVTKLCHFERAGAVMASRGQGRMALYLRGFLGDGDAVRSLDDIDAALPQAFASAQARIQQEQRGSGVSYDGPQSVRLAGYSARLGRIVGIAFEQSAPLMPLVRELIEDDTELAPWDDRQGELPAGDSIDSMRQIVLQQIAFQRQLDGDRATIGGDLVIAEVLRGAVRVHRFAAT